ncbi:HNH endonuclease [Streptomyces sp. 351MFTsu5.1]|uniref:HNH endonuclease n=1 Tax=Streptomyces sp. 351MFTsu5.1 TaxID=1172180 RepID=UPI0003782F86|nr:HNH endonuclease [Streptomyces sp. 351MFTsu5.1]
MTDSKPTKWAIAQYWANTPDEDGRKIFAPHLGLEDPCCFTCGWYSERWKEGRSARRAWERARLERAHIIPAGLGGSDKVDNIILMCTPCHEESPDWFSPWEMAIWISKRADRPSAELEQVNDWIAAINDVPQFREMLGEMATREDGTEVVLAAMRRSLAGAVVHGAGVGLRRSTMTAIARRTVQEVRGAPYLPPFPVSRARCSIPLQQEAGE